MEKKTNIQKLIAQIKAKDQDSQQAVSVLYKLSYPRFKIFISTQLIRAGLFEKHFWQDIFHDAFTVLITQINTDKFPNNRDPFSYMGKTIKNMLNDILAGYYKHPTGYINDIQNEISFDGWDHTIKIEEKESKKIIDNCFEKLKKENEHWWQILKFRYYENMKLVDISRKLKENINTTRSNHHRAIISVKTCIEKNDKMDATK